MAEVFLIGQIKGAQGFPGHGLWCTFEFKQGPKWQVLYGSTEGRTHVDAPAPDHDVTWAHPIGT